MIGKVLDAKTFLVFVMLFLVLPCALQIPSSNRKASLKSQVPGRVPHSRGLVRCFPTSFSLYFAFFPNVGSMYGSLSTLIMVMLWLYCCMNLLLYGAEVNALFRGSVPSGAEQFFGS